MNELFLKILNMSISAGWLILVVLILRLVLKKVPKWSHVLLWGIVILTFLSCAAAAVCFFTNPIAAGNYFMLTSTDAPARTDRLKYEIWLGDEAMSGEIYVEQWLDGACVKSAPIAMTQYVDSIEITMRERREDGASVGTDIQIETNLYGGSLLTYFAHPDNLKVRGWGFKGCEMGKKHKITPSQDVILAAKVFDSGSGIRAFDCETLSEEPERIENAEYMIVVRAIFSTNPLGTENQSETSLPAVEVLTRNEIMALSQKGYELTWADFENYNYTETGSGLYIRIYEIDDTFQLMIGGGDLDKEPMYIYLALADDIDTRIDIREGGAAEFIAEHSAAFTE